MNACAVLVEAKPACWRVAITLKSFADCDAGHIGAVVTSFVAVSISAVRKVRNQKSVSTRPCALVRQPSCVKDEHTKFSGSIPAAYDRYLGPILFQPYAEDLASRLPVNKPGSVLELACGTGILTRVLRTYLPSKVKLIATDLNEPMFRQAAAKFGKRERVRWLEADACDLDAMRHNKLGELAHRTITSYFENDPPTFYKVPFSYHNRAEIRRILKQAGFREIKTEVIAKIGKANRAKDVARGLVEGNPVAVTIAKRDPSLLPIITGAVTAAITRRFGERDIRAPMRAIVVRARA
ncbi:MAG: hypothetical protein DME47_05310 [Verrucomicrobia bacterium]|nr:MAG: hypothetical protein DME47_05310 [Verrucomicrobiota bacterium]